MDKNNFLHIYIYSDESLQSCRYLENKEIVDLKVHNAVIFYTFVRHIYIFDGL